MNWGVVGILMHLRGESPIPCVLPGLVMGCGVGRELGFCDGTVLLRWGLGYSG